MIRMTVWKLNEMSYWVTLQLVGRDFLENIPRVPSFALAGWLDHGASYKSKHRKTLVLKSFWGPAFFQIVSKMCLEIIFR